MSRYIDADKIPYGATTGPFQKTWVYTTRQMIASVPTADVEEVKHGHWADDDTCSVCGVLGEYTKDIYHEDYYFNYSPYCSHCGAKMDGERREE